MNKNIAIFTTKYIIENVSLIAIVLHDNEGDWQFLGNDNDMSNESARIVSLGEIITLDPSVETVLWIPEGLRATRNSKADEWVINID